MEGGEFIKETGGEKRRIRKDRYNERVMTKRTLVIGDRLGAGAGLKPMQTGCECNGDPLSGEAGEVAGTR